jgi:UV DNA damage endonuclease
MIRLGYACLTLGMPEPSMRAAQLGRYKNGLVDLQPIYVYNAEYARRSIDYSIAHGLEAYRLSSDIFPLLDIANDARKIVPDLRPLRQIIETAGMHVSNHPSQFVVLSSPHENVVTNALQVMDDAGWVMESIGARGSITIHGGGVFGDRAASGARLAHNIDRLSPVARRLVALENDEKSWTVIDLVEATAGKIPIVFDKLHWQANARSAPYEIELREAIRSWPKERLPEFHYSEQENGKPRGAHAEWITGTGLLEFLEEIDAASEGREVTVIVEAKRKDMAIARAIDELSRGQWQRMSALVPSLGIASEKWRASHAAKASPTRGLGRAKKTLVI